MSAPCQRCGAPVAGTGKTGMCKPCAVGLAQRKRPISYITGARRPGPGHRKPAPVTLPKIWGRP